MLLCLLPGLMACQEKSEKTPAQTQSKAQGKTQAPEVTRATLDNGLRVVIVRNQLAPVATIVVNYLVGSNEAPPGFPGMAHAQEHMMFRGSPGLTANQLANITAGMGGKFDANTQQTITQYFFTVPADDLEVALHVEADRMRNVLDSDQLWDQERGAIEQEVAQDLSNPQYVFYSRLLAAMFKGTPYAHDALGTKASFDQTTGAMLKQFYDAWYAPNNAIMVIAGDVDPEKTLAAVKELFGPIPSKKLPPRPEVQLQPVTPEKMQFKTDLPYGAATVSFRLPGYDSRDHAAAKVLAGILNNHRGNLYALTAEGKALTTSVVLDTLPQTGLGIVLGAFPKDGDPEALLQEMRKVLQDYLAQGFPPDLVEAAKRSGGGPGGVSEGLHKRAGHDLVQRPGPGRPGVAGGRRPGGGEGDGGGCRPGGPAVPGPGKGHCGGADPRGVRQSRHLRGLRPAGNHQRHPHRKGPSAGVGQPAPEPAERAGFHGAPDRHHARQRPAAVRAAGVGEQERHRPGARQEPAGSAGAAGPGGGGPGLGPAVFLRHHHPGPGGLSGGPGQHSRGSLGGDRLCPPGALGPLRAGRATAGG